MNSIIQSFIGLFVIYLSCTSTVNATTISTDWWSNRTDESNIREIYAINFERIRLDNFTSGFIEGTVILPFASNWEIEFAVHSDESLFRDPNDSIDIYIDGLLIETVLNTPVSTIFDIQYLINGSSFDYRFDFISSNSIYHLHPRINEGSISAPSAVPTPAVVWLLGSGLIGLVGMRRKSSKVSA